MREAQRYEELAAYARSTGHSQVSAAAVQGWVKGGLLPKARWEPWGFGRRSPFYPATLGRQIDALCRLRYASRIRRLPLLGVALWLEGWTVEAATVRAGLTILASGPERFISMSRLSEPDAWEVANVAVYERGFKLPGTETVRRSDLALGLGDFVAAMAGTIDAKDASDEGLVAIGHSLGLDRAATDLLSDGEPWLPTDPVTALREAIGAVGQPHLLAALDSTTDVDLDWARALAVLFRERILDAAERFAKGGDPGFGGLAPLAPMLRDPLGPGFVVLAALAAQQGAQALVDGLVSQGLVQPGPTLDERAVTELVIIR